MNGTLVNYYFHCKRQCYLFGNRLNLEDNSELVQIGRAIHEEYGSSGATEIAIDNIKVDKLTAKYLVEVKKSDADEEATKWQTLYYLWVLKGKGIERIGKVEYMEKNKKTSKTLYYQLDSEIESELKKHMRAIDELISGETVPEILGKAHCKKCAYYEYCYI